MALKRVTHTSPSALLGEARTSRQAWGSVTKPWQRCRVERPLVQILVVVANIQVGTLKTEVEKGSMVTAVGHGSVDPKR